MPRISIEEPGKDAQAYRFDMKRMKVTMGRSSENDVTIAHRSVSKLHCFIERRKGGYMVFDNGSTNGIKFDGEKLDDLTLTNGMVFDVGDVPVEFSLTDEECDQLTDERFSAKKKSKSDDSEELED